MGRSKVFFNILLILILISTAIFAENNIRMSNNGFNNIYYVEEGTDQIATAISQADSSDIIELVTSGGLYYETNSLTLENKALTVRARVGIENKPVIKNDEAGESDGVFRMNAGASLTLSGVEFQHAKYLIRVDNDSTAGAKIKIDNCIGHTAKENFVKVYSGAWLDSLIVTNSIFRDCEKNGFYMKEANTINYAGFENVTMIKAGREAIIINDNPEAVLRVNHCTFDSISWNDDNRIIYPKEVQDVKIKNSVFSNQLGDPEPHGDAVRIYGNSSIHHCNLFNVGEVNLEDEATLSDTLSRDPMYTDPSVDNYTLESTSPLLGAADDGTAIGDLKWDSENVAPQIHYIEAGTDQINAAISQVNSDDIIELVTSGGLYYETQSLSIENKKINIRARAGLENKPVIKNDEAGESDGVLRMNAGASLTLNGVEFQHAKYLIRVDNDSTADAKLKILDCKGHLAKENFVKVYGGAWLDSLIVKNTFFRDCEKNGFSIKEENTIGYAGFENMTMIKAGREAIVFEDNPNAVVRINHCTFDSCSWNDDRRVVYPKEVLDVEIKNSVFSNQLGDPEPHGDAVRIFGTSSIHHCNFYNAGEVDLEDNATMSDTLRRYPSYNNPAQDDYRLALNSPLREAADDGTAIGDLRWEVSPDKYYLNLDIEGKGQIVLDPAGGVYEPGNEVEAKAISDYKWGFEKWEGDFSGFPTENPTTVTMDSNKELIAVFENLAPHYPIIADVYGPGQITFTPEPDENGEFEEGTEVTIEAVTDTPSVSFSGWTGDTITTENPISITVSDSIEITAEMEANNTQFTLDIDTIGMGDIAIDPQPYEDFNSFDTATVVNIQADSKPGYIFNGWSGDTISMDNPIAIKMDSNMVINGEFIESDISGALEIDDTWDFREAVEYANNNSKVDSLVLTTPGGLYTTDSKEAVVVTSALVITADSSFSEKPIITNSDPDGGVLEIIRVHEEIEHFVIENVLLDGGHDVCHGMKYGITLDDANGDEESEYGIPDISINNCEFKNMFVDKDRDNDGHAIKYYKYAVSGMLRIENCDFYGTGYEAIRISETEKWYTDRAFDAMIVKNCSFTDIDAECIRYYSDPDPTTPDAPVTIEHITINNCATRCIYLKNSGGAIVRDVIIANSRTSGHGRDDYLLDAQGNGDDYLSYTSHIDTFNVKSVDIKATDAEVDQSTIWGYDPMFESPEDTNYTLMEDSPVYGLAHDGKALGDLRWAKYPPTGIENSIQKVDKYKLSQNYPNPFNPVTNINFQLKNDGFTTLEVYDMLGRKVQTIVKKDLKAGAYKYQFNATGLPSGVYFYRLHSKNFTDVKKLLLLK